MFRPAEPPNNNTRQASGESNPSSSEPTPSLPLPPIPEENRTALGKTIRIGELEVTPLAIDSAPLKLVRSIEPPEYRREGTDSLVLRLEVTNISKEHALLHSIEPSFEIRPRRWIAPTSSPRTDGP